MSPNMLFWSKLEAGKRWQVRDVSNKLLGFIRFNFNGWEGYILTGNKWPDSDKGVNFRGLSTFWGARRAVERELRNQ